MTKATPEEIRAIIKIADKHTVSGTYKYIRLRVLERVLYRKEGEKVGLITYDEQLIYWNRLKRIIKTIQQA